MGCIISGKGVKFRWSNRTLCGKSNTVQDIIEFFTGKVNCTACLIKQDALFTRGYEQKKYVAWCNREGRYNMVLFDVYNERNIYGERTFKYYTVSIPRHARQVEIMMWDADTVKGTLKLAKLGAVDLGGKQPA